VRRLGANGRQQALCDARRRASSTYAERACRPATAAVVIATSDVTDYGNDDGVDGRTVMTSRAPGVAVPTNCLCRYDDDNEAAVDAGGCGAVLPARLGLRPACRLKATPLHHCQADQLVRPS